MLGGPKAPTLPIEADTWAFHADAVREHDRRPAGMGQYFAHFSDTGRLDMGEQDAVDSLGDELVDRPPNVAAVVVGLTDEEEPGILLRRLLQPLQERRVVRRGVGDQNPEGEGGQNGARRRR